MSVIMRGSRDARAVPFLAPGFAHARGRRFFGPFADRSGPLNFTIRETAPEFGGILKRFVNKTPGQSRYNSTNREIGEGNELLELLAQRMDMCERLEASSMGFSYDSRGSARAEGRYATQVLARLTGKPYDAVVADISAAAEKYRAKRLG